MTPLAAGSFPEPNTLRFRLHASRMGALANRDGQRTDRRQLALVGPRLTGEDAELVATLVPTSDGGKPQSCHVVICAALETS